MIMFWSCEESKKEGRKQKWRRMWSDCRIIVSPVSALLEWGNIWPPIFPTSLIHGQSCRYFKVDFIKSRDDDCKSEVGVGGLYTVSSGASGCSPPLSRDEGAPNPPDLTPTTLFIIARSTFFRLIKFAKNGDIFGSGTLMPHGAFFTRGTELTHLSPSLPLWGLFANTSIVLL